MIAELKRLFKKPTYTIGKLFINGKYVCDTVEDTDRGLVQSMPLQEVKKRKVYGETAIPYGTYVLDMNTVSKKYSNPFKYKWAKKYDSKIPRLLGVPGFEGVLIHTGNSASDSLGCIIVGKNTAVGKVLESVKTFYDLMDNYLIPAKNRGEQIILKITGNV